MFDDKKRAGFVSQVSLSKKYAAILKSVSLHPQGASLKDISNNLIIPLERRTLQRYLAVLVEKGAILVEGKTRSRIYRAANNESDEKNKDIITFSSEARVCENLVTLPIQKRSPVGYNRQFLDQYRPNVTAYLSDSIVSKLQEIGKTDGERPAGTFAREIYNRLLIDLSWNSSRLEGNTYSILETERLLQLSEVTEGKDLAETQMILNHKSAIEFIIDNAEDIDLKRNTILNIHALLSNNLLKDPEACGRLRTRSVGIAKSVYHPLIVPSLIQENFEQILDTARAIQNPFEQAFFLMVHIPYLQPFEAVNKRVSRLVANIPLIQRNLAPLSFVDVPQKTYVNGLLAVYELNKIDLLREVFLWAYERSCALYSVTRQTLGEPDPFRMRYRTAIFETVSSIVRNPHDKRGAVQFIKEQANQFIPLNDRLKFIEIVEIELRALHEGNIARYKIRPHEYTAWMVVWR